MRRSVVGAVDVGSGATKALICRAVLGGPGGFELEEVLFEMETEVLLAHSVEGAGKPEIAAGALRRCEEALKGYRAQADRLGAGTMVGVGTQVFRAASNGEAFLRRVREELGIQVRLVSQEEEGRIGFATACALVREPLATSRIVSWDSGGASFQLARAGGAEVLEGPLGSSTLTAALVRLQGRAFNGRTSPNPVSKAHADALCAHVAREIAPAVATAPAGLHRLGEARVVAIGGGTSAFNVSWLAVQRLGGAAAASAGGACVVEREPLRVALSACLGKTDEELETLGFVRSLQPDMVVPKLCLVHTVMGVLGIDAFEFCRSTGSCLGVLAMEHGTSSSPRL